MAAAALQGPHGEARLLPLRRAASPLSVPISGPRPRAAERPRPPAGAQAAAAASALASATAGGLLAGFLSRGGPHKRGARARRSRVSCLAGGADNPEDLAPSNVALQEDGLRESELGHSGDEDTAAETATPADETATAKRSPRVALPISKQEEDIRRRVREQRVTIIVGGTGCGKSTQVPQFLLDDAAAHGQAANILVTQPRRMAAVMLARRVAEERGATIGKEVGYRIRGEVVPGKEISFVTAGYLLSWLTMDPAQFATATHIVLDEAHVRSADMELLMLLVRMLMRLYPGPKLVLMSATIETGFFARYFAEFSPNPQPQLERPAGEASQLEASAPPAEPQPPELAELAELAAANAEPPSFELGGAAAPAESGPPSAARSAPAAAAGESLLGAAEAPEQPAKAAAPSAPELGAALPPGELAAGNAAPVAAAGQAAAAPAAGEAAEAKGGGAGGSGAEAPGPAEKAPSTGGEGESLYVGSRVFPVELLFLDDLVDGRAPGGRRLPKEVQYIARGCVEAVFNGGRSFDVTPRVWNAAENLAFSLLPALAEAGSTILVFIPGYADLCRLHSKLYWNLPVVGSVNTGWVPPKPEELEDMEDDQLNELDELEGLLPRGIPRVAPSDLVTPERPPGTKDAVVEQGGTPLGYRLFALHSQVPNEDQELVLDTPAPGICHIVLATTIAESSLTLPEVCGVLDFGVHRTTSSNPDQPGLTLLMSQWCAKSALKQREGRAGRTRPGWCVRLVPRLFFEKSMPDFEEPEILRTPLAKLVLQAKGISDGLLRVVAGDEEASQRLGLSASSPSELLMQLPEPPQPAAIRAAVEELTELGAVTRASGFEITVLGRIALWMPLDVRLCRMLWLGALWGCVPEAVVLAAACSTPPPFQAPSRLASGDNDEFTRSLRVSAESRRFFDGGHFSEPLMCLRLFCSWARRLKVTKGAVPHDKKWFNATASLAETFAIDPQKMAVFVGWVADLALRARDMCSDARGEDDACSVRADLHLLVRLLRRPDLTPKEQRARIEKPPRLGEVFRASPDTLYALLAASFSNQVMIGRHRFAAAKDLGPMLNALGMLAENGIASPDAVLIPCGTRESQLRFKEPGNAQRIVTKICGVTPAEVVVTEAFAACSFAEGNSEGGGREQPIWMRDVEPGRGPRSKSADPMVMGTAAAPRPRLTELSEGPRLCFMAAGGLRTFTIEDTTLTRAVSPYELQFNLVSASERQRLLALFSEQNPLGFPCHITSPEVPLGADDFACVSGNLFLSQAGFAVRVSDATLLTAEQVLYALATVCPSSFSLSLGFVKGCGGSAEGTRAELAALRLQRHSRPLLFGRHLPGLLAMSKVNEVRSSLLRALMTGRDRGKQSKGQEVLLWQDNAAMQAFQQLVDFVRNAPLRDCNANGLRTREPWVWVAPERQSPPLAPAVAAEEEGEEPDDDGDLEETSDSTGEAPAPLCSIQALEPIVVSEAVEMKVARVAQRSSPLIKHKFECPDCGERFMRWESCQQHYERTCHLDISSDAALRRAQELSKPVCFRCPECGQGFPTWTSCKKHLDDSQHLAWTTIDSVAKALCMPPPSGEGGEDADVEAELERERELEEARAAKRRAAAAAALEAAMSARKLAPRLPRGKKAAADSPGKGAADKQPATTAAAAAAPVAAVAGESPAATATTTASAPRAVAERTAPPAAPPTRARAAAGKKAATSSPPVAAAKRVAEVPANLILPAVEAAADLQPAVTQASPETPMAASPGSSAASGEGRTPAGAGPSQAEATKAARLVAAAAEAAAKAKADAASPKSELNMIVHKMTRRNVSKGGVAYTVVRQGKESFEAEVHLVVLEGMAQLEGVPLRYRGRANTPKAAEASAAEEAVRSLGRLSVMSRLRGAGLAPAEPPPTELVAASAGTLDVGEALPRE